MIKVLNLYAGIGGNRKLWENVDVTAVELNPKIAGIYQDFFPDDKVIVDDAHAYLLEKFEKFDFIWSSPPCPTHSMIRKATRHQNPPVYLDMKLYEEVLLLQGYYEGNWVVENVKGWYKPLVRPYDVGSHYFWSNKPILEFKDVFRNHDGKVDDLEETKGFSLKGYSGIDKIKTLRNCVEPELGLHVFNSIVKDVQPTLDKYRGIE